ncbi:MAG: hypothetical protein IT320_12575 [Anaerolineae bacterium]|nr:hypothetical protein [Anaerolineae bacterium]
MLLHYRFFLLTLLLIVCTFSAAQAAFGTNWTATYYNCTDFACPPVVTQTGLDGVNYDWGTGSPYIGVNADNFTIRFESVQTFVGGRFEFVPAADDGMRVFIDGALVYDQFYGRPFTEDRFQQTMTAGPHTLRVDYLELTDLAQVRIQWFLLPGDATSGGEGEAACPFTDGRLNCDPGASAVIYCYAYGIHIYGVDHTGRGFPSLVVTPEDLAQAQQDERAGKENILIASGPSAENGAPINLYLLSTGELQAQAPGPYPEVSKPYRFIFGDCLP